MPSAERYYRPSGRVGVLGVVLFVIFGVIGAVVLASLYAIVISAIQLVYVIWMAPFFLAGGVGWMIGKAGRLAKVRNVWAEMTAGALAGLLALYLGWIFWIGAAYDLDELIFDLPGLFGAMAGIASEGIRVGRIWVENKSSFSGWTLWLMWTLEALVIVGGSAAMAVMKGQSETPFCGRCRKWCRSEVLDGFTFIREKDEPEFVRLLEEHDYGRFDSMHRINSTKNQRSEITLTHCPACGEMHLITVRTHNEKAKMASGTQGTLTRDLVRNLYVPPEVHEKIRAIRPVENEPKNKAGAKPD